MRFKPAQKLLVAQGFQVGRRLHEVRAGRKCLRLHDRPAVDVGRVRNRADRVAEGVQLGHVLFVEPELAHRHVERPAHSSASICGSG